METPRPPSQNLGVATPNSPGLMPMLSGPKLQLRQLGHFTF